MHRLGIQLGVFAVTDRASFHFIFQDCPDTERVRSRQFVRHWPQGVGQRRAFNFRIRVRQQIDEVVRSLGESWSDRRSRSTT